MSKPAATVQLHPTRCPICDTPGNATELYPQRLNQAAFEVQTFSARRLPDRVHYRVVRCASCGLVRSDPVADAGVQAELYAKASFDYTDQVDNLRHTYGRYLARLRRHGGDAGALLEIGCGNGFVLQEALRQGYQRVVGVEPSLAAVANADPSIRESIVCDIMRPGLFHAGEFDAIAMFQTFDHISEPTALLAECLRVLKPGGLLLAFNHDVEAPSARLLGERSPIVDVEHPFLYSRTTLTRLLETNGFRVREAGVARNRLSLRYLGWLLPLPGGVKGALLKGLTALRVGAITLSLPLGNLFVVAQKPAAPGAP